ncbi:Type III effector protein (Skwp 4) [Ralstonia solanacearum]|uniref:XopAD/skwp family type III secretion system effector n=1 Tax=Ralstonia solanacearum TaxID=305 RepID=UPI001B3B2F2B|nr:XopAD/skwp family type III secretion system effector [Ralstonia solanacearum]MDB0511657.1 Type III effector protein (Skwp 4) [Ralstonia solanacearum]MDB0516250.1 Type III effector protein (Skwp 4) [Ralstonia solanacearum]QTY24944.1 Type III effector protein (Skwp 4) [Ralstonia solanacearum]
MVSSRIAPDLNRSRGVSQTPHPATPSQTPPQTPLPDNRRHARAHGPLADLHHAKRSPSPRGTRQSSTTGASSSSTIERGASHADGHADVPPPRRLELRDSASERAESAVPERARASARERDMGAPAQRATLGPRPDDTSAGEPVQRANRERSRAEPSGSHRAEPDFGATWAQLADYGRWLNSAALQQLKSQREDQCGQLQKLAAQAKDRKVDPHFCPQLASDNVLARRNRFGQALVFLDGAVSAEENARRLSNYLWILSRSSQQGGQDEQRRLARCVDIATSYLLKTNWFEGAPFALLANLGNHLSKYPDRRAAMAAIAWIAGQVLEPEQLPWLTTKQLALLANAFSKNPDNLQCEQAMARIASQELDPYAEELATLSASLLFNAMSKWPDNPDCRIAAEQLAERLAEDANMLRTMTAQEVASTLNALSKWPDSEICRTAVEHLADRLTWDRTLLLNMFAQQVANALNALSKWPKADACRRAAPCLARRVLNDDRIVHTLNPQGMAITLNGLSKWPEIEVCGMAAERLAERLAKDSGLRQGMGAQQVANALNALSKWPDSDACRLAAVRLAERLAKDGPLRQAMSAQQVANALNALAKWPDEPFCAAAAEHLAARLAKDAALRQALSPQQFVNVLTALSKWPKADDCRTAAERLAARLPQGTALCQALDAHGIANALGALSKWPDTKTCRTAADHLAERLARDSDLRHAMDAQGVATALNALSKWPDAEHCRTAAGHLAARLAQDTELRRALDAQGIANALNGLSKWPDADDCRIAAERLAARLAQDAALRQALDAQGIASTLNALSKWPDAADCKAAAKHLAKRLANDGKIRRALNAQGMANAFNALSKWPDEDACRVAAGHLARRLAGDAGLWKAMSAPEFASTLNALSKWPDMDDCRTAAEHLAGYLVKQTALLQAMDAQGTANTLNALSKWPDAADCKAAAGHLAARLADDADLRQALNALGVASALNALSKWPDMEACRVAAECLAVRLAKESDLRQAMSTQQVASALNALSKWPQNETCRQAAIRLADALGSGGRPFATFDMAALAQLANGIGRFALCMPDAPSRDDDDEGLGDSARALLDGRLRELAAHLNVRPAGLDTAETRDVAMVFKALSSTGLKDGLRLLATQGLQRLQTLQAGTHFRSDSLETLGSLAAGLLPLIRARELKAFRADTLRLLERMQTDVARKMQHYVEAPPALAASEAARSPEGEAFGARRPGLTFFLLLKTYAVVAGMWKLRNVADPDDRPRVAQRREALKAWVGDTLEQVRGSIESDLDEMSWNLIAQIEAGDHVFDALDLKLQREMDRITTAHPSTQLNVAAVRHELRGWGKVRDLMNSAAGAATLQIVDMRGQDVRSGADALANYSFFTRLTGGKLPLVEVEMAGKLSAFMLARALRRDGDLLRMDLFGGSHLTPPTARAFELLSSAQGSVKRYGRIPAIRLADTVPNAPLMKDVIRKLNPQREDWYRMQRALLEVVPRDHVVEGPIRLALLADRLQGTAPAFALRMPTGEPIRLVPNDGCGFIRESLARRIPAVARAMEDWDRARGQSAEAPPAPSMTPLPPQATHHYPRDAEVIEAARGQLRRTLREDATLWATDTADGMRRLSAPKLYNLLTGTGITGVQGIAVPSADDKVYLPGQKSGPFDHAGGPVLLGKAPYDKPNLMPVPAERVGTPKQGDATARFLDSAFALQYSYTAWDENRSTATDADDDAPMLHGKGVTIVVPDALWPRDTDAQWVWSTEDMKIHSSWTQRRERDRLPARMDTVGSLRVKDIFTPGSLIAVPINELRKRDADCDGDKVFVYAGVPEMAQAITRFFETREQQIGRMPSFKPPKTANAAFDEAGHYHAGRAAEVLSAVRGQVLVRRMSTLQFHFWAQPQALRERIAEQAIFGTYEGTRRELRRGVRRLLYHPAEATPAFLQELCERARLGAEHARHPVARQAAQALQAQLEAFAREPHETPAPAGQPQALPSAVAQRFTSLANAYAQARTPRERLAALAAHYPTALLPHPDTDLPAAPADGTPPSQEGQLGYVPEAPLETLRNLLTLGVKVGTDAPKAVTQTDVYLKIADRLERALHDEPDRINRIAYTKGGLVPKLRKGLDVEAERLRLHDNPTLAAGLMEMALEELQAQGLIDSAPPPGTRAADTESRVRQLAHALHLAAKQAEASATALVKHAIHGIGELRDDAHRVKSEPSLFDKLRRLMLKGHQAPENAAAAVDDALRYSVVLVPQTFVQGYADILGRLDAQGLTRTRVRNSFDRAQTAFKGVNVSLMGRDAAGKTLRLEIQFHTRQTFALKVRFHNDYKQEQALYLAGASREQQHAALARAREAFEQVTTPPGCASILDWDNEPPRTDRASTAAAAAARTAGTQPALGDLNWHINQLTDGALATRQEVGPLLAAMGLAIVQNHSTPKHAASLRKKIERYQALDGMSLEQATARVRDAMRWVVQLPAERFTAGFGEAWQALEAKGLSVMRIKNGFAAPDTAYAGLNLIVRSAAGRDFEIQFHTDASLRARNASHRPYRTWQDQEVKIKREPDPAKRLPLEQANAQRLQGLKERAAQVPLPVGVKSIASFSRLPKLPSVQATPADE